jgi:hypothetical protein
MGHPIIFGRLGKKGKNRSPSGMTRKKYECLLCVTDWENGGATLAEAYTLVAGLFAGASEDDLVAIG